MFFLSKTIWGFRLFIISRSSFKILIIIDIYIKRAFKKMNETWDFSPLRKNVLFLKRGIHIIICNNENMEVDRKTRNIIKNSNFFVGAKMK